MRLRLNALTIVAGATAVAFAAEAVKNAAPPPATTPAAESARPSATAPATGASPAAAAPRNGTQAAAATPAPRAESSVAPSAPFDNFRLVSDRNIFNPNRSGRRERTNEDQPPRVDVISVVGTMESDRGLRAFFDGSEASYRRAVRVGESVDQFKVTQISPNVVALEREGKSLSVRVGQQLRRAEGADWDLVGEDVVRREAQERAADAKRDPGAPPPIPDGASDIEKRMRERRLKDFKR
jgi:hypothetical protein